MNLQDWESYGWINKHTTNKQEISNLLSLAERDLKAAQIPGLPSDWRLNIAYNALLQSAIAALAASGYRAGRQSHHYHVIRSLELTLQIDEETVNHIDSFRKKRNESSYDRAGAISESEADEMVMLANLIFRSVKNWLQANHPDLLLSATGSIDD